MLSLVDFRYWKQSSCGMPITEPENIRIDLFINNFSFVIDLFIWKCFLERHEGLATPEGIPLGQGTRARRVYSSMRCRVLNSSTKSMKKQESQFQPQTLNTPPTVQRDRSEHSTVQQNLRRSEDCNSNHKPWTCPPTTILNCVERRNQLYEPRGWEYRLYSVIDGKYGKDN